MESGFSNVTNASCDDGSNSLWTNAIVYPVLYAVMSAIICLGNILVLDCYRKVESARTVTNVFIVQLAVADLCVGVTLPFLSSFYIVRKLRLFDDIHDVCIFSYTLFVLPACASVLGLLLMTLDRFLSILFPLKYRVNMNKCKAYALSMAVVWFPSLSFGFVLPNLWRKDMPQISNNSFDTSVKCNDDCDLVKDLRHEYLQFVFVPSFFVVAVVIFLLYIPILHTVRKHLAYHKSSLEKGTATKSHKNVIQRKEIKMMTTTILILGAFFLCWVPLMVVLAAEVYFSMDISKHRGYLYIPPMLNSALNPIIYALRVPAFNRQLCKRIPCLKPLQMEKTSDSRVPSKCANEMNQLSVHDSTKETNFGSTPSIISAGSSQPSKTPRKIVFKNPPQWPNGKFGGTM